MPSHNTDFFSGRTGVGPGCDRYRMQNGKPTPVRLFLPRNNCATRPLPLSRNDPRVECTTSRAGSPKPSGNQAGWTTTSLPGPPVFSCADRIAAHKWRPRTHNRARSARSSDLLAHAQRLPPLAEPQESDSHAAQPITLGWRQGQFQLPPPEPFPGLRVSQPDPACAMWRVVDMPDRPDSFARTPINTRH